jgi:predicted AlkP superfamily pyrophosphatase or phosphodiesterase
MKELLKGNFNQSPEQDLQSLIHEEQFIYPRYQGESILNILPSIASLFGLPDFQHPALENELLTPLHRQPQNIILVLLDALAYHRLENWLSEDKDLGWHQIRERGVYTPLTSICPSTTSAAITSYWTDSAAGQHGIMGYEMWLKEYGITANMIEHKPITYRSRGGSLDLAGFDPETFLPVNPISNRFIGNDIEVHAYQHFAIINSGMSQMFMGGANRHAIATAPDMWISIRELLESAPATRKYIWAYWGQLDGTSHLHGPDSERARAEFLSFSKAFDTHFLDKLDPSLKRDTLVILTADHGQITTDPGADQYDLKYHPQFTDMLHILPTGENRLAYLHVKPGKREKVKEYIHQTWPDEFAVFETEEALQVGLFGPGKGHPALHDRLGDLIVAARGDAFWWWSSKPNPLIGRHGGFSPQEMLVPFLASYL